MGGTIDFPTANLQVDEHVLLPSPGVYLMRALGGSFRANGLLYIGYRPTLGQRELRCEIHLLDSHARPLYGEVLDIHLLEQIRRDPIVSSLEKLDTRIEADVARARQLFPSCPPIEERISS